MIGSMDEHVLFSKRRYSKKYPTRALQISEILDQQGRSTETYDTVWRALVDSLTVWIDMLDSGWEYRSWEGHIAGGGWA